MASNNAASAGRNGTSSASLLGVAFVVLKLTHVINWSWWYVLAPFWIGWAVVGTVLFLVAFIVLLAKALGHR
jgi:phosphoglycerol transferase MdoB-like AlkP superfamily enzyme